MKRVLIFAHDFPPLNSIGAMRPESWYNHFYDNGLFPIIVTRNWGASPINYLDYYKNSVNKSTIIEENKKGIIIKVPFSPNLRDKLIIKNKFSLLRKFLSFCMDFTKYRSFIGDNTRQLYFEAEKFILSNKVDFIIATGEPWISFKYAHLLSKKYNIPWASDYRDGWNTSVFTKDYSKLLRFFYELTRGKIEKKYAKSATFISISDPDILKKNMNYLRVDKNKFINPLNGYDENKIKSIDHINQSKDVFKIGYAGTIYPFQRLDLFLDGLNQFINECSLENDKIKCYFIGSEYREEQKNIILNYNENLKKYLITTPRKTHLDSLKDLRSCNLLLLLCNDDYVALPAKLFEYFGLERKILIVKNDKNVVEHFVKKTNAGYLCNNVNEVIISLKESYFEFLKNKEVKSTTINKFNYSRKFQSAKLAIKIKNSIK